MMPQMLDQYVYLNTFLKIYERSIKDQFIAPLEVSFSPMVSIIEKEYVAQHVVTRLVEKWREDLDEKFVKDAVLTDLSKAFDCIKHDLLIAKRTAFGFSDTALNFITSWKQGVCIISTHSNHQITLSGVPQGSISGPVFFDLSINDLLLFVSHLSLHNIYHDNTLRAFAK